MTLGWKYGLIVASVLALVLCGLAFRSRHRTSATLAQIEEERSEIERLAQHVDELTTIEASQDKESSEEAAAVDSSVLGVLDRLEVYARRVGVRCTDISQPPDMMPRTHVFQVSGEGQPESVARFFAQVEEDRGPLAVDSVRVFHENRRILRFNATVLSPKARVAKTTPEEDA